MRTSTILTSWILFFRTRCDLLLEMSPKCFHADFFCAERIQRLHITRISWALSTLHLHLKFLPLFLISPVHPPEPHPGGRLEPFLHSVNCIVKIFLLITVKHGPRLQFIALVSAQINAHVLNDSLVLSGLALNLSLRGFLDWRWEHCFYN